MPHAARTGFTLIELLVVIAIIALLVSILMPSLNQARELARQAVCAVNLRNIGAAVFTYAEDYDGGVPPHWSHNDGTVSPWVSYAAYWEGGWPVIGGKRAYFNLAPLEFQGYVPTGKMFYCPSHPRRHHQWEFFRPKWEELTHQERIAQAVYIRTGYMYNPHDAGGRMPYKRIEEFPLDRAMGLDVLMTQWITAHSGTPGWSLLFGDSHVELKVNAYVFDNIPYDDSVELGHNWSAFAAYLEDLEQH